MRQHGLKFCQLKPEAGPLHLSDGSLVDKTLDELLEKVYNSLLDNSSAWRDKKENDNLSKYRTMMDKNEDFRMIEASLGETFFKIIEDYIDTLTFDENNESFDSLEHKQELYKKILYWHVANLEYGCGTDLRPCSYLHWDQDDGFDLPGTHNYFEKGYLSMIKAMMSLYPSLDVQYNREVIHINYETNKVYVTTQERTKYVENPRTNCTKLHKQYEPREQSQEGKRHIFEGDFVVITVPLGVLKKQVIQFSPTLPELKLNSIKKMGFGVLNKVILEFPHVFWSHDHYIGIVKNEVYEHRGDAYMFWNMEPATKNPVLVAIISGKSAFRNSQEEVEDRVSMCMDHLRSIYGDKVVEPTRYFVTEWHLDDHALGTYSYIAPGCTGEDYDKLALPVSGKVFFAGEHTCRTHPATVLGGFLSGIKAAGMIQQSMEQKSVTSLFGQRKRSSYASRSFYRQRPKQRRRLNFGVLNIVNQTQFNELGVIPKKKKSPTVQSILKPQKIPSTIRPFPSIPVHRPKLSTTTQRSVPPPPPRGKSQQQLPPPPPPPPPPRRQSQQQLPPRGKSQQQLPPPPPPPPKPKKKVEPIMLKKEHYFVAIDNVPSSNRMIEKFKLLVNTHLPLGIYRHAGNLYVEFDQNAARYARLIDGKVLKSKSTGVTWVISAMAIKRSEVNASWKPLIAKFSQKSKDKLVKIIRDQIKFPSSIAPSKEAYKALVKMLKKRIQMQITEDNLKNTKAMIKMIRNMLKKEREKIKHA
eukprot:CAMPEP_0117420570 /NCGR_PEP_ID=MMETSP0758-20121206/1875_1 /TAXON_ID=63605 /ORGANISM="Percolomonas cosmopolitus, Strain AE-1 (ATCC 50343)" /LENGTH=750 /DNA_ID=CAMNT_0005202253 /DNA_START=675 /DNA_END=2927 /DNA_ORIENTATION=-